MATICKAQMGGGPPVPHRLPGAAFRDERAGGAGRVDALGGDATLAARDMVRWQPPGGRGTREEVMLDPVEGCFRAAD